MCVQNFNWLTWCLLLLIFSIDLLYITFSRYIKEQVVQRKLPLAEKAWIILTVVDTYLYCIRGLNVEAFN